MAQLPHLTSIALFYIIHQNYKTYYFLSESVSLKSTVLLYNHLW